MRRHLFIILIVLALLAACGPSPEVQAMLTAASWTETPRFLPTETMTPSPTKTVTPTITFTTSYTVKDEAGCPAPSNGQLYTVEKHGYSQPVEIPWPAP